MLKLFLKTGCIISYFAGGALAEKGYDFGHYAFPDAPREVVGVRYRAGDAGAAVPLGGIGTGTVYLTSKGTFEGNALTNNYRPILGLIPGCFFAVRMDEGSQLLQTVPLNDWPTVKTLSYLGHTPMVDIDYQTNLGMQLQLRATTPFILGDSRASGTPGAMFKFRLSNLTEKPKKMSVAFSWYLPDPIPSGIRSQSGDADGCVYWNIGNLNAGQSTLIPVVMAVANARDEMAKLLKSIRGDYIRQPEFANVAKATPAISYEGPCVTLHNGATELIIDRAGALNYQDQGSAACITFAGQPTLTHYAFRAFYTAGENPQNCGIRISSPRASRLENIRITIPTVADPCGVARTELQSNDGTIVIQIATQLTANKTAVVQWYRITNVTDKAISRLRFVVYANQNLSKDPMQDTSAIDPTLNALVITGSETGSTSGIAVLTGLKTVDGGSATSWDPNIAWWLSSFNEGTGVLMSEAQKYIYGKRDIKTLYGHSKKMVWASRIDKVTGEGWTIGTLKAKGQQSTAASWRWSSDPATFWKQFSAGNSGIVGTNGPDDATVAVADVIVPAKGHEDVGFILSWYYPNARDCEGGFVGHQYTNWFDSSLAVTKYLGANWETLWSKVGAWQEKVYKADVPDWLKDNTVNSLVPLIRNSCWVKNGRFTMNESFVGCPIMDTIVCRFYGTTLLARFFPDLEKNVIKQFADYQRRDGAIPHCFGRQERWNDPYYEPQKITDNTEFVLMVWRDYYLWHDRAWAREMLPVVKKALKFAQTLDTDGDGLINEHAFSYYDQWQFYGTAIYTCSIQLAALRAAEELAKAAGDDEYATYCYNWFSTAQKRVEELLWNGKYYRLYNDPAASKKSETILHDQLIGQWYAYMYGLGEIFPKDHIESALEVVAETNSKAAKGLGLVTGVMPNGKPDMTPPAVYAPYVTIGGVYCHSASCIYASKKELGLRFSEELWNHTALKLKRPFNQAFNLNPNNGNFVAMDEYYSNMCVWDVFFALTGNRF
jgi:uncharacterized protein (DUF608 family)